MGDGLPFRRFDVVDRDNAVRMRGTSRQTLFAVSDVTLEDDILVELRPLLRERRSDPSSATTALIGLDYRIGLLEWPGSELGQHLVVLERITIRGAFERLVERAALDEAEIECARLLVAGSSEAVISLRLGLAPIDAAAIVKHVLQKTGCSDRNALQHAAYARARVSRHHEATSSAARNRFLKLA